MRLIGEGDAGERGASSGDLYIVLYVKDSDVFERRGNDLYCEVSVTFARAALGGQIPIPIIGGQDELKIPEGTQPGQTFSLRGKGMPDVNGRSKGDQHVIVRVAVPTKLSPEQRDLLRQFALTMGEKIEAAEKGILGRIFNRD